MSTQQPTIIYTLTDEAPLLATYSLKPIVEAFASTAGSDVKPAISRWPPASPRSSQSA